MRRSKSKALVPISPTAVALHPMCISCGNPLPADWPFGELDWHKPCLSDALYAARLAEKRNKKVLKVLRDEALKHYKHNRDEPIQSDTSIVSFRPVHLDSYTTEPITYTEVWAEPRKRKAPKPIGH